MTEPVLQRDHTSTMGRILYTSRKPERLGEERGREWFRIDVHADGTRTCVAHSEIDDRPSVMRDIAYSLDRNWKPTDCFVRLSVGDRFMGSGWFRFHPEFAECETWTAAEGRLSQRMDLARPLVAFQNHAIACDAWHLRLIGRKPGKVQRIEQMLLSSPDHRGATGPMLFSIGLGILYVGEESIEVGAGRFDAWHYRFVTNPELPQEHPPYDVWCTADDEFLFLKGGVAGYMQTHYELAELTRFQP
ncbi:MAG TPA: hypothetical protein VJ011_11970 [Steroidobacteraceae bacterium]|nr:hypothetical protein [Steroidobacteraceae bacterium]